jgi:O-antigen/teichoic acid export membrane protein
LRHIFKQFSLVVLGRVFAAMAQAAAIVMLARWSSPEIFGSVVAVQTLFFALTSVLSFGFPQYIGVLRARNPDSRVVDGIYRVNQKYSWITSALSVAVLLGLAVFDSTYLAFLPLGLSLGLQRNGSILDSLAIADGQVTLFSSNLVLRRVVMLTVFVGLYRLQVDVALAYCTAVFLAEVIYNARMRATCIYRPRDQSRIGLRPVFRESKHFWIDAMSGQLRLLDVAAISIVLGPLAAGYLAVPSKIASPLMLLPSSFATLLLPRVSAGNSKTAQRGIGLAVGVTIMISVLLIGLSLNLEKFITQVLGESYLPAAPVTRIYFIGFVGLCIIYMVGAVLQGLGLYSAVGRNSVVFSVLSIVFLSAGGYVFGIEGAAWGYVIGCMGQVLGLVYLYVFRHLKAGPHVKNQESGGAKNRHYVA